MMLSARASAGTNHAMYSYTWRPRSGTSVILTDGNTQEATFSVPSFTGSLVFELTVRDTNGRSATDSITLLPGQPPEVSAGEDLTLSPGSQVVLENASAVDSDGSIAAISWRQLSGNSAIRFDNVSALNPTITLPDTLETFTLELTVRDNNGLVDSDTLTVISQNQAGNTSSAGGGIADIGSEASSGGGSIDLFLIMAMGSLLLSKQKRLIHWRR